MDKDVEKYSSLINRFVDTAMKYPFDVIKLTYGTEQFLFSIPLTQLALDLEESYKEFYYKVDEINASKLNRLFMSNIERYNEWFLSNKHEIESLFGENNIYNLIDNTLKHTKNLILEKDPKEIFRTNNTLDKSKKDSHRFEKHIWFKVGLLFATGAMDKLIKQYNNNATKISDHLKKPEYNKYILATMNNYTKSNTDKNIYGNKQKMIKIKNHCTKQDISMTKDFLDRFPAE